MEEDHVSQACRDCTPFTLHLHQTNVIGCEANRGTKGPVWVVSFFLFILHFIICTLTNFIFLKFTGDLNFIICIYLYGPQTIPFITEWCPLQNWQLWSRVLALNKMHHPFGGLFLRVQGGLSIHDALSLGWLDCLWLGCCRRYYFSLFLELSDISMPLVRAVVAKVSSAVSFFLVSLIGRSLGLIYTGIRQALRWKWQTFEPFFFLIFFPHSLAKDNMKWQLRNILEVLSFAFSFEITKKKAYHLRDVCQDFGAHNHSSLIY